MNTEIQIAQNFILNFLYNKLPRRRVNLFGEELELALLDKFQDHWYPDQPFKGSAYRCLKITDPSDPVLNRAARESGNPISDIIENLPADLAMWIDPGEVSYRIGEKGSVQIIYSERSGRNFSNPLLSGEPELENNFSNLQLSGGRNCTPRQVGGGSPPTHPSQGSITYTAGMFAKTKFGSTKLKTKYTNHHKKQAPFFNNVNGSFGSGSSSSSSSKIDSLWSRPGNTRWSYSIPFYGQQQQQQQMSIQANSNFSQCLNPGSSLNTSHNNIQAQNDFINELFSSSSNGSLSSSSSISSSSSSSSSSTSSSNEYHFDFPSQSISQRQGSSFLFGNSGSNSSKETEDFFLHYPRGNQSLSPEGNSESNPHKFLQLAN